MKRRDLLTKMVGAGAGIFVVNNVNAKPHNEIRYQGQKIFFASQCGAKLDSNVLTGGGTDDTEILQQILNRAGELGNIHLVMDGAALIRGLVVHSNTTIECFNRDCGFFLADSSDQHIIRNANQRPLGIEDGNISFIGGTYNGNAAKQKKTDPVLGWLNAFSLHGVQQLLFRDVSITNMRTFAVHLTNWRRVVFENIYINLDQIIIGSSNQDGIHVQGPGQFLTMRNIQGRTWDDMIALNADDVNADWNASGEFVRNNGFGQSAGFGPITDVDIDGVHVEDAAQAIRLLSRGSRIDRVSIRNVRGVYRTFGIWLSSFYREGGNFGRIEFENIDLRATAPNAYEYLPPFLFYLAGKIESVHIRNVSNYMPIDDRPVIWIAPDAKINLLKINGIDVYDLRTDYNNNPVIRADGDVKLLQIKDVVIQRPKGKVQAGSLIATGLDRSVIKPNLDRRSGYLKPDSAKNFQGWPEAYSYLDRPGTIEQLRIDDVTAEQLEHVVNHGLGKIGMLSLTNISVKDMKMPVNRSRDAEIGQMEEIKSNMLYLKR